MTLIPFNKGAGKKGRGLSPLIVRGGPIQALFAIFVLLSVAQLFLGWPFPTSAHLHAAAHSSPLDGTHTGSSARTARSSTDWQEAAAQYPFTIATGANSGYFHGLTNLVGSIHYWCPKCKIVIYDLGLTPGQVDTVKGSWCNVELRALPATAGDLKKYAWKPPAIQHAVETNGVVLWLDAGSTVTGPLDEVERVLREDGIWAVQGQDLDMVRYTHHLSFAYFHVSGELFRNRPSFAGNTWAFVKGSPATEAILKPWVACSLVPDCIAPPGSGLFNHRYDQAVSSIITYMAATTYEPNGALQFNRLCPKDKDDQEAKCPDPGLSITHHTDRLAAGTVHLNASGCYQPSIKVVWTSRQGCGCYVGLAGDCLRTYEGDLAAKAAKEKAGGRRLQRLQFGGRL